MAICNPLHYGTLTGNRACAKMAAAAWARGFLYEVLRTGSTFSIPLYQGNAVDQFFCEVPQLLKLSCSDSYLREAGVTVVSFHVACGCFGFIVLSYVQIFRVMLRIPSELGWHKAFPMCLPHLAVVSLFVSTAIFLYLKPPSSSSPALELVVAVLYSVIPPRVNPLIYSMRNQRDTDAIDSIVVELNLLGDVKGNKKGFCRYISSKEKTREYVSLVLNGAGDMVTKDVEKAKVYSAFFASDFPDKTCLQESQAPETCANMVEEDRVREHLNKLDIHLSMGPDGMYP
ncbi:olfactory receptor 14C36-like [Apteryx mantelli]|uniref:Olfactory receptor 14C36-like n=1 Tax=Apteryx mantelli TaxID=2696672 RepID=A0ABM4G8U1_9AVES